jgi:inorganic pyrophosphatase
MFLGDSRYEIQSGERFLDFQDLSKAHVTFSGSPHGYPHDPEKIILIVNPLSTYAYYYEFKIKDISYVRKLSRLVSPEGETILMAQFWVKQGSIGIRSSPFRVERLFKVAP